MLKTYLLAKIGVDTAENEPDVEEWRNGAHLLVYLVHRISVWENEENNSNFALTDVHRFFLNTPAPDSKVDQ